MSGIPAGGGVGVIGIVGPAYSGSSILSRVLNTDPHVFGGGELRRLVEEKGAVACTSCGPECPVWTADNLRLFGGRTGADPYRLFYVDIARVAGATIIVDSSKQQSFFSEAFLAARESEGVRFVFVLPVKHPVRLFSSYVYNEFLCGSGRRIASWAEVAELMAGEAGREVRERFLPRVAHELYGAYMTLLRRFVRRARHPCLTLKHEELAAGVGVEALTDFVANHLGRRPLLDPQSYAAYPSHATGENRAPIWQASLARDPGFTVEDARFGYYRERPGIQLDQKHLRVLPADLIRRVLGWRITNDLCGLLGYAPEETEALVQEGVPS